MASPFYLFRKYQKAFLVIAGVMAMFIFVVADPLMSWLQSSGGGGGQSAGTVVASWDGGKLNVQQLQTLTQRRYKISGFLTNLVGLAAAQVEQEGGSPIAPSLPDFRLQENTNPRAVQVGCVTTRVLAELARESGITVSDKIVNHYLKEWGLRRMDDSKIAELLGRFGMSDKTLFSGLRELLLGNTYINSYSLARGGIMPEERWQDWKRINERIAVDAAVVPAEKFVADVPDPSESELRQFYNEHKDRIDGIPEQVMGALLPSPNPGFREPRRVKLQYLVANVDDWTQKMMETVTEEEIVDYYERNKRTQFVRPAGNPAISADGLFDDSAEESEESEAAPTDTEAAESDTAQSEAGESEAGESEAGESEAGESEAGEEAEMAEPESDSPAEDSVPEEPATEEPAAEESSTEEPATEEPALEEKAGDDESSALPAKSPFRLTAFQTDEAEAEDTSEAESTPASEDEDSASAGEVATDSSSEAADEETVVYEPLENVREQIQRSLARDKAVVELQKVVDEVYSKLNSAFTPYGSKLDTARREELELPKPPASLSDFVAIAKETGLTSEETVLLSQMALSETIVGRAFEAQSRREFVVQGMFDAQEIFDPYRAMDLDGNAYIVSKTEDVPSSVPEFEKVRDAVLTAWKKKEAAKLALAKAEELAKQAQESDDPLATLATTAGYETVTTDMFSWLTFGTTEAEMQRGPRLGDAPPLEAVGTDIMTKVFDLQPEEKIALLNHDQSNAYVLQLNRREQSADAMRQQFLAEANSWYGANVMSSARWSNAQRQLLSQLYERVGLDLGKLEGFLQGDSQ